MSEFLFLLVALVCWLALVFRAIDAAERLFHRIDAQRDREDAFLAVEHGRVVRTRGGR